MHTDKEIEPIEVTYKKIVILSILIIAYVLFVAFGSLYYLNVVKGDIIIYKHNTYQISQSSDDAYLYFGKDIELSSDYIYIESLIYSTYSGFIFQDILKYSNATINEAIISFYVDTYIPEYTTLTIYGIKGNSSTFSTVDDMLHGKEITSNHVNIDAGNFIVNAWNNITVTNIVQEIISSSWIDGDNVGFKLLSVSDNFGKVVAYDGNNSLSAKLYIKIKYKIESDKQGDYETTYEGYDIYYIKTRSWEFADDLPDTGFALGGGSQGTITVLGDGWGFTDCDRYADKYYYKSISESTFHYLFLLNLTRVDDVTQTPFKYYKYQALQWVEGSPANWANLGATHAISVYISGTGDSSPNDYQLWIRSDNPDKVSQVHIGHVDNSYMVEVQRTTGWFNMTVYTYPAIIPITNMSQWIGSGHTYTNLMTVAGIDKNDEATEKYSGKVIRDFIRGRPAKGDLIFNVYDEDGNQLNGNFTSIEDAKDYIDNYLEYGFYEEYYAPFGTLIIVLVGIFGILLMPISIILVIGAIQRGDYSSLNIWFMMFFIGLSMAIAWLWG